MLFHIVNMPFCDSTSIWATPQRFRNVEDKDKIHQLKSAEDIENASEKRKFIIVAFTRQTKKIWKYYYILALRYLLSHLMHYWDPPLPLQKHRNNFITVEDFNFLYRHGINTVRIPVGWWIAYDPNPPPPFIGGSLEALDNAFSWAQ